MKTKLLLTILTLCSGLSLLGQIPSNIPQNGLVAWYPFNGNANDESGNGNNGSINGASLSTDRNGNANSAFYFNGNGNYISVPSSSSIEPTAAISYSCWMKPTGLGVDQFPHILIKRFCYDDPCYNGFNSYGFHFSGPNKTYATFTNFGLLAGENTYQLNQWTNLLISYDGQHARFYYNGNLMLDSLVGPNLLNYSSLPLLIGYAGVYGQYFEGQIDDIAIYNRALNPQEITGLYSGLAPCQNTSSFNSASITQGETYSFNGQNLTTAGTYTTTLQNAAGCDSVLTLNLTVLLGNNCFTSPDGVDNNNGAYPVGWSYKDFIIPAGSRLDSIYMSATRPGFPEIYYDLTISRNDNGQIFSLFNYDNYNAGMYNTWFNTVSLNLTNQVVRIAIPTNAGAIWNYLCFSISTVCENTSFSFNSSINQGETYSFNGQNLTTAGTYTTTLQNAAGCDSLVTLSLNVLPSFECNIELSSTSICKGDALELSIQYNNSQGSNGVGSISSQGLVASYMYNANTLDNSGNGNNAENLGCSLTNDRLGNPNSAYYFNGGANMISNLENSPVALSSSAITISAWINVYAYDPTYNFVPIMSLNDGSNRIFEFFVEPNLIGFWSTNIYSGVNFNGVGSGWKQVAVTFDNGFISYYFNGELVGVNQTGQNNLILHPNCILEIGRDTPGLTEFYNGNLDDLNIWNRALSANEISSLYGTQFAQIAWSTGETTPSISVSPTETTTYSVTVTQGTQTCTSDVTITVNQPTAETVNASITEGETYSFKGQNLTNAGTYTSTLQNAAGCDSVVTLNLTVNPAPVAGCYASSVVNFNQGPSVLGSAVSSIRSNATQALGQPEAVVTNVVNFVSLGFGGTITVAFETPIANGAGNDIRLDEATWGNNPCSRYPEKADVFASQDGTNFIYLGQACQDASFDLGSMSWAKYIRLVDVSDILSFNNDADGFDLNGIECLNGSATNPSNDGLEACTLQEIVSYTPGNRKNGTAIPSPRNNANNALGMPQSNNTINFVALGFGGSLIAKFDYVVFNQPGNDLRVTETSFGNPSCTNYPEKARVSLSLDSQNWVEFGGICQDGTIEMGTMPYAQYIRIQDASPMSSSKFNKTADGYDLDAVVVLNNGCGAAAARLAAADNTTTPNEESGISVFPNPMQEFTTIRFDNLSEDSEFTLELFDGAGRLIQTQKIEVSADMPEFTMRASDLAHGIYQVLIHNETTRFMQRLVK